jgi:hypothetical protein
VRAQALTYDAMKTLSQISEAVYWLETEVLRGWLTAAHVFEHLRKIRQDLEPHICTPAAHDTPGEGTVPVGLTCDQPSA